MAELNNAAFTGSGNPQITYKVTYGVRSDGGYGLLLLVPSLQVVPSLVRGTAFKQLLLAARILLLFL